MRFRFFAPAFLAVLLFVSPALAQDSTGRPNSGGKARKIWKISAAVLGAVTIADMHSSMGRLELNPLLRNAEGRFTSRGVSLKALMVGGALLGQHLMLRKHPEASGWAAGANFAAAAATGAAVARNHLR
jgi:hypothetical protein